MTRVTAPSRLHFGLFHVPTDGFTHWPGLRFVAKSSVLGVRAG